MHEIKAPPTTQKIIMEISNPSRMMTCASETVTTFILPIIWKSPMQCHIAVG